MKRLLLVLPLFVSLFAIAQQNAVDRHLGETIAAAVDTIYVSNQAKSYLLFDEAVSLADVGNPLLYQAQIEGNSVLIIATQDSVADTPFYAVVGDKPFTARLFFHPHPPAFYNFRSADAGKSTSTSGETLVSSEQILTRLQSLRTDTDLNYATERQNGIRFRLVGLIHDFTTTYLKFKVENHTSLIYQTDFIGFERLKRYKKGFFAKDQQARFPLEPVAEWQIDKILPYSENYLYYAIPLQSLERKEAIIATLRENGSNGMSRPGTASTRSVSLKISSRLIRRADLY